MINGKNGEEIPENTYDLIEGHKVREIFRHNANKFYYLIKRKHIIEGKQEFIDRKKRSQSAQMFKHWDRTKDIWENVFIWHAKDYERWSKENNSPFEGLENSFIIREGNPAYFSNNGDIKRIRNKELIKKINKELYHKKNEEKYRFEQKDGIYSLVVDNEMRTVIEKPDSYFILPENQLLKLKTAQQISFQKIEWKYSPQETEKLREKFKEYASTLERDVADAIKGYIVLKNFEYDILKNKVVTNGYLKSHI